MDNMMDEKQALEYIADHYGINSQLSILQEECAELIQAISKYRRSGKYPLVSDYQHLVEEITDVEIMITQIKYLASISQKEIDVFKAEKINRQLKRIREEEDGK